ncbi:MAG: 2-hydroxychromene-2-carboxylate isomerase [Burkholderiaceae bacterium]|nr:2-hydroxychromene-2-carboxylate isomerase [Burkholderiaceae bacterium]
MQRAVEFVFDVGSPYSYLAYHALPAIAQAAEAQIVWQPILLGAAIRASANHSPFEVPAKMRWVEQDLVRCALSLAVAFSHNAHFPVNTLVAMRIATGLQMRRPDNFPAWVAAAFRAMWGEGRNLADPAELAVVIGEAGLDDRELLALASDQAVKDKLRSDTDAAVSRGVFGAPTFFVGDQMFWGHDRLDQVARSLAQRGGER